MIWGYPQPLRNHQIKSPLDKPSKKMPLEEVVSEEPVSSPMPYALAPIPPWDSTIETMVDPFW